MTLVLRFGDVRLYDHDLETVAPGEWVGDVIIEFYYEYLERAAFPQLAKQVQFVQPAVACLLSNAPDAGMLAGALPPDLGSKQAVFLPVNDSTGLEPGGSHWSLLCFYKPTHTCYYYDSLGSSNLPHAQRTARALDAVLGHDSPSAFVQIDTPVQVNGFDCGVYVMVITHILCSRFASRGFDVADKPGDLSGWRLLHNVPHDLVARRRTEIRELILKMSQAQKAEAQRFADQRAGGVPRV
ncbi:hypothetical protein HK105_204046 [Polyrhizophydium stewartii]|uniref:Ubiquitin-like protease family profile domain-containing protein n=1 Tax=Polyrhizophydium stewartii TaxID=2732419 RepID=A0ABR4N9T9_9FUNG|nr:SUMO1 sentrin specific peptidase 8 [Polyrhizophydium stewartii]